MEPIRYCTNCGHQLSVGRYCTNCGARVPAPLTPPPPDGADYPTAVRPGEIPPVPPLPPVPPVAPVPPGMPTPGQTGARYPLYADSAPLPVVVPTVPVEPARRSGVTWLVAILAVVLIALIGGALLLLSPSGENDSAGPGDRRSRGAERPGASAPAGPDAPAGPVSVLDPADVDVPETARASVDEDGDRVTFAAGNMLDADPRTSWRMPGDGTGSVVTFRFDEPVTITEVGLVNGYAKLDPPHDWYAGNRRIAVVVWAFDDPEQTEVEQELGDDRELQTVSVAPVTTTRVELRILEVTEPGDGPDRRDFTAISDVELTGTE